MLVDTLMKFGLSNKEAKTYLALLELEHATAGEVAKKSGLNRSSTYVVLEALKKLGFVISSGNGVVQKYSAESPEKISKIAKERTKSQKSIEENINKILPELRALHKDTKHRPKVYVYEGKEAVQQGMNDIFDEQVKLGMKKFRVYQDLNDLVNFCPPNFVEFDAKTLKNSGAKMFLIAPNNKASRSIVKEYKRWGSTDEFTFIPENEFSPQKNHSPALSVYEDKIEFFLNGFAVVIENKGITDTLKKVFDLAWKEAKNK